MEKYEEDLIRSLIDQDAELNHGNRPWGKQPPTALQ